MTSVIEKKIRSKVGIFQYGRLRAALISYPIGYNIYNGHFFRVYPISVKTETNFDCQEKNRKTDFPIFLRISELTDTKFAKKKNIFSIGVFERQAYFLSDRAQIL